jgi:hypothetical protein
MATGVRPKAEELYEQDFYVWTEVQAELLRQRRFETLDLDNLIEEVEGWGDAKNSAVLSNATVVVEHLLKLHRNPLEFDLTPRLRQILQQELARVYELARRTAERRLWVHGENVAGDALPSTCPYTFDQITGDWWP